MNNPCRIHRYEAEELGQFSQLMLDSNVCLSYAVRYLVSGHLLQVDEGEGAPVDERHHQHLDQQDPGWTATGESIMTLL